MDYVFSTNKTTRYQFPTHINDLVMDRSEAEYSEVFLVIIEPGKAPPVHKHDDTEQIFFLLQGSGTLHIGKDSEEKYEVSPGDLVRIPVGTWHTIKTTGDTPVKYLAIDCFGEGHHEEEPTWESHVKELCREQGWNFEEVKR